MKVDPLREHQLLHRLIGEWTYDSAGHPDKPETKAGGREIVRSVGGVWVIAEGEGQMPGGAPASSVMTLGYDDQKKRYVGTWIGSMMTNLWVYDGFMDAEGKTLTLEAEGPSMADAGTTAKYRDIIEFVSDEVRLLKGTVLGHDGEWQHFMTTTYTRKR